MGIHSISYFLERFKWSEMTDRTCCLVTAQCEFHCTDCHPRMLHCFSKGVPLWMARFRFCYSKDVQLLHSVVHPLMLTALLVSNLSQVSVRPVQWTWEVYNIYIYHYYDYVIPCLINCLSHCCNIIIIHESSIPDNILKTKHRQMNQWSLTVSDDRPSVCGQWSVSSESARTVIKMNNQITIQKKTWMIRFNFSYEFEDFQVFHRRQLALVWVITRL